LEFLTEQRKTMRRRSARESSATDRVWKFPHAAGAPGSQYVNQLGQFMKDWNQNGNARPPEFLEYLIILKQANGR